MLGKLLRSTLQVAFGSLLMAACSNQTLDAGNDTPRGLLPIDGRNPVILSNDGCGNWQGLYAVLFANTSGPPLAGIIVNASEYAEDLTANIATWQALIAASRESGLRNLPDPVVSDSTPLVRPANGNVDATVPNASQGARVIVEVSQQLALPYRPLVVVTGGRLTDVADAYLLDPSVKDRVVVLAALGTASSKGGTMGAPNGELDPWADWIVAMRFEYIQVSAFYDPTLDIPSSTLAKLPNNPLGAFIVSQQPGVTATPTQADQISIIAAGLPEFVTQVQRATTDTTGASVSALSPTFVPDANGRSWLVTHVDSAVAGKQLWQMLRDPKTYGM